jgi:hypothetical protein
VFEEREDEPTGKEPKIRDSIKNAIFSVSYP